MTRTFDIAVLGATGTVGATMLEILAERKFPVGKVYALASERSAGETMLFNNKAIMVEDVADFDFYLKRRSAYFPRVPASPRFMHRVQLRLVASLSIIPRIFVMMWTSL